LVDFNGVCVAIKMVVEHVKEICRLSLCFISWFKGCVLVSKCLFSYCEWCWFVKCSSSCLEHCFSKDVIVHPLLLVVYVIQKTLMRLQVRNVIIRVEKNGLKKITHKHIRGKYHFVLSPMWVEKKTTHVSLANVQYNLFSSSM